MRTLGPYLEICALGSYLDVRTLGPYLDIRTLGPYLDIRTLGPYLDIRTLGFYDLAILMNPNTFRKVFNDSKPADWPTGQPANQP